MKATLLLIERADGAYRPPLDDNVFTVLCRYTEDGKEWWLLEGPLGVVVAKAVGDAMPVAGKLVRPDIRLDKLTWLNPSLPKVEVAPDHWLAVGQQVCICAKPGWNPLALDRQVAADYILSSLLQESPELADTPVIRELIDELPVWSPDDSD